MVVHPSSNGLLGCFHLLGIVNNALNMGVQISVQIPALASFALILRSGTDGLCVNSVFNFFAEQFLCFSTVAAPF